MKEIIPTFAGPCPSDCCDDRRLVEVTNPVTECGAQVLNSGADHKQCTYLN